uniref:Retrotransposon protein n=1 Tax=Ascaris lumbricoides TaxID=6252 RepID=A0A0M3IMV1_ASCLU
MMRQYCAPQRPRNAGYCGSSMKNGIKIHLVRENNWRSDEPTSFAFGWFGDRRHETRNYAVTIGDYCLRWANDDNSINVTREALPPKESGAQDLRFGKRRKKKDVLIDCEEYMKAKPTKITSWSTVYN